jgi:uncharacterized protein YgiM (DUF1202 family)
MKMKKTTLVRLLLFLVLAICCCPVFVSAANSKTTYIYDITYNSVTARRTKLYKTIDKKEVLLTIPKGKTVTVLKSTLKKKNTYKIKYNGKTGFVDAANILDSSNPATFAGDMSAYEFDIQKAPSFYVRARNHAYVYARPDTSSNEIGTIFKGAIVGVYGTNTNGFYIIGYHGERMYVLKSDFAKKKASPIGTNMYVASINGGNLRQTAAVSDLNLTATVPYKTRVTLLCKTIGDDDFTWYRVLVVLEDKYYVEGYMREDVLTTQKPTSGSMPIEKGGSNRVVNTGTNKNAILRDGPNGTQIGLIQNKSTVYATGRTSYAGGRDWAEITSPKKGWIAASFIF